jgi:NACalpha-BTF3-like transcription factor
LVQHPQQPHEASAYSRPFSAGEGKRTAGDAQLDSHHHQQQHDHSSTQLGSVAKKARVEPQDIELDARLKESKRLVARRLEQPKGVKTAAFSSSASASALSSATEALPAGLSKEQMEALRLKRRKKKLTSIQSEDIPERISGTRDKPSYVEADALVTADIINRERQLRTRISVLHSETKRFTDIIGFMQQYQEREKKKKKEQQQKQAEEQVRSSGYNRYDINEKQLWRTSLGALRLRTGISTPAAPLPVCQGSSPFHLPSPRPHPLLCLLHRRPPRDLVQSHQSFHMLPPRPTGTGNLARGGSGPPILSPSSLCQRH